MNEFKRAFQYRKRMFMAQTLHLNDGSITSQEAVKKCVEAFKKGKIIVVPTETVYGVAALASKPRAVAKLVAKKERQPGHALPLAVADLTMLRKVAPNVPPLAERLARKLWPGPITLVLDVNAPQENYWREYVAPKGTIGFRCPDNPFLLDVLYELDEPIVLTSANYSGKEPACSVEEAEKELDFVDLFVDNGNTTIGKPSTVLKIEWSTQILRDNGALSLDQLAEASRKTIVFVGSENVDASPLAMAIAKYVVAKQLNPRIETVNEIRAAVQALPEKGFAFYSAGVNARRSVVGVGVSDSVQQVATSYGVDLTQHASQRFGASLAKRADLIFATTQENLDAVISRFPECKDRALLLSENENGVKLPPNPSLANVRSCAKIIQKRLENSLAELF